MFNTFTKIKTSYILSGEQGLSLMFVGPDESKLYTKICMGTNKLNGLDYYQIQQNLMREVKMRVKKAVELDKLLHKEKKVSFI